MKILLTTDTFYPMINGVVISTDNLYKELKAMGHDVRILTLSEDGKERIYGDIYYLKSMNLKIYPGAKIKKPFNTEIGEKILGWSPDIIHSQTEFSTMINAKHISRKLKIPHVHTYHTMYEDYINYILNGRIITPKTIELATRLLLNSLDRIIAPTEKVKNTLVNYNVKSHINIIPTGIDLRKFQNGITAEERNELLKKHKLNPTDKVILYLGRIAEEKNIHEIINMFGSLKNKLNNTKLLVVGTGPHMDYLVSLSKEKNLYDRVIFTGMINPDQVYKYYNISDVFVTASTSETQGLTYIEALSCGLPVVCRYDPCIEGVIKHRTNGMIYNNENEFKKALEYIFTDDIYARDLSKHAKITAERYSSKTFAKSIEEVYKDTIASAITAPNEYTA